MDTSPQAGQTWMKHGRQDTVRVMGIVEGYVVVRYKGAAPFLESVRRFVANYIRLT